MKYGCEWGDWCTSSVSGPYGVSLWKNIRRGWLSLSLYILYDVGDGLRVKFWQDWWCGETSPVVCYPELFSVVERLLLLFAILNYLGFTKTTR